jgi:hypothetical protein
MGRRRNEKEGQEGDKREGKEKVGKGIGWEGRENGKENEREGKNSDRRKGMKTKRREIGKGE